MLRHEIQQLIGKSVQDLEDLYLSTLKHLPWYGTTFFPIVRTDNREGKFLAINVDGFQILDENKVKFFCKHQNFYFNFQKKTRKSWKLIISQELQQVRTQLIL